jgi:death-on-curing family protein
MAKPISSSKSTTVAKYLLPSTWLSINDCKTAYATLSKLLSEANSNHPLMQHPELRNGKNGGILPAWTSESEIKLEGILGSVRQEVFGVHVHESVVDAAAAYFVMLIKGHPLPDGNKRASVLLTTLFLSLNQHELTLSFQEMYSLALIVAEERKLSFEQLKHGIINIFDEQLRELPSPGLAEFFKYTQQSLVEFWKERF